MAKIETFAEYQKMVSSEAEISQEAYDSAHETFAEWSPGDLASMGIDILSILMTKDTTLAHRVIQELHKSVHAHQLVNMLFGKKD